MSISPDQITLSPNQRQQLARLSEQCGKPWDAVLAEVLRSYEQEARSKTEGTETVYEAMLRLGLLGSVKDGPPDLSTNTEYMEGFGGSER